MSFKIWNIAIDIRVGGQTLRYAQRKAKVSRTISGDTCEFTYLPYIKSFSDPKFELEIDSDSPIPSFSIEVWDADRQIAQTFASKSYEAGRVTCYFLDKSGAELYRFETYLTSVSFDDGILKGALRLDEDRNSTLYLPKFGPDTFQSLEVLSPMSITLGAEFEYNPDTPWDVVRVSYRRNSTARQNYKAQTPFMRPFVRSGDGTLLEDAPAIRTNIGENYQGNRWIDFEEGNAFFVKLLTVANSTAYTLTYTPGPTVVTYTSPAGPTLVSEQSILSGLQAQLASAGFASSIYGNRLYIDEQDLASWTVTTTTTLKEFDDQSVAGIENFLKPVEGVLFDNPNGAYYNLVNLGDTQYSLGNDKTEIVAYCYATFGQYFDPSISGFVATGDDNLYLSGIPTDTYRDPATIIGSGDFSTVTGVGNANELWELYGIKGKHSHNEIIAPQGAFDKVYLAANGLVPYGEGDDDPELSVGFIWLGREVKDELNKVSYKVCHRYEIVNTFFNIYDEKRDDGTFHDYVLELKIHNRPTDPAHIYATELDVARWEVPAKIGEDTPIELANFYYLMSTMSLNLTNLPDEVYDQIRGDLVASGKSDVLRDRYKGVRVDQLQSLGGLQFDMATSRVPGGFGGETYANVEKLHQNILSNATGKFAICVGSEMVLDDADDTVIYEKLYFYVTESQRVYRQWVQTDPDEPDATTDIAEIDNFITRGQRRREELYVNFLRDKHSFTDVASQSGDFDFWGQSIKEKFLKHRYRVIRDPVPENSKDLGKSFPICYGYLERVPLLQVISKKSFMDRDKTAGDDTYVYSIHPCDVGTSLDIILEVFGDKDTGSDAEVANVDKKDFSGAIKSEIVVSPFPLFEKSHWVYDEALSRIKSVGQMTTPYHKATLIESLDGLTLYGLKLRGSEWDYRLGPFDRRYPIRNGIGSSTLYGTFGGKLAEDGSLIEHPIDIMIDFMKSFGRYPFTLDYLNLETFKAVRSLTPRYKASIYLTEDTTPANLINELAKQFGILLYHSEGKLCADVGTGDDPDLSRPISEGINIIGHVSEESNTYKDSYTEVVYSYDFSYPADTYQGIITLNAFNNRYCARAAQVNGGQKKYGVEAKWCRDYVTATLVVQRLAKTLSRPYVKYSLKVKHDAAVRFTPADEVPLTYSPFGLENVTVKILSVTNTPEWLEMEVIRYL